MAIEERFGAKEGTIIGVQARPISNINTIVITGVQPRVTQVAAERIADVTFFVDGQTYRMHLVFADDTLEDRGIDGQYKRRAAQIGIA